MAQPAGLADLRPQLPVAIQRGRDSQERFRGQLLGQVSPELLVIAGAEEAVLVKGERIVVRTLQSGKALGFETTVSEVVEHPVRLLFVEVPQAIEAISLRKADRLDVFVPADIRFTEGNGDDAHTALLHGNMLDISGGGCRVFTKRGIPLKTVVNVSFTLPGERHACAVSGSVLDAFTQNAIYGQRIKFFASEKNVEDLGEIKRWVQQNLVFADVTR
ncbi:MAG TPA: PilZ domain-containing protein [bacterium]|nr:PilZ domain-containing protein [bacterium]